jgi:hypothetical protein
MLVQLAGEGLRRQNKSALQKILGKNPCMSPQVTNKAYHIG